MALTSRISLTGPPASSPEDYLSSALGVIFPDDVTNQHGDSEHSLQYTSPHMPRPLYFDLAEPENGEERRLFSHYLWNSSLLLAELVEAGTLHLESTYGSLGVGEAGQVGVGHFDVTGLTTLELGAGTALPSILAALLGAASVVVTDYPAPLVMQTLRTNIKRNVQPANSPAGTMAPVLVEGHSWGELENPLSAEHQHSFDRIFLADCLWMPWQHANLHASTSWFLKESERARVWVVAGFHTGREKMRGFFDPVSLKAAGLEVERIWERDCDGQEREWVWDRGIEDISVRKRWLVIGILKRVAQVQHGATEQEGTRD